MAFDYSKHERNIAAFLAAVDERHPPALSAPESAKAVAIIEACYQSARTGQPVRL
jgi:predicted dehydrogenase